MIIRHLKAKFAAFPVWVLYLPWVFLILAAILVPIGGPTNEDPTGGASSMAPILALSAVTINILRDWRRLQGTVARLMKAAMTVGMFFSAYFWLATQGKEHPYSTQMITGLSLIVALMVIVTVVALLPFTLTWILRPEPEDK